MTLLARIPIMSKLWPGTKLGAIQKEETEQRLGQAVEQRRLMTVTFLNPELADMDFSGPCFSISGTTMFIDFPYHNRYSVCRGEAMKVFFSLESGDVTTYFQFTSEIQGYKPAGGFAVEIPAELSANQRREFLRITPPMGSFLHMNVWPIASEDFPSLSYSTAEYEDCRNRKAGVDLVNISTGGLRLQIKNRPDNPVASSEPGAHLLVFLRLQDVPTRPLPSAYAKTPTSDILQGNVNILTLWLAAVVKYRIEEATCSNVLLGLNFIAWAVPKWREHSPLWSKAGDGGQIPLLTDWVWQHHLALAARSRF